MITIFKTLRKISPAFNPIELQVTSSEQTRLDFRFLVRVKDAAGKLLATSKKVGGANVTDVVTIDVRKFLTSLQNLNVWRYNVTGSEYIYNDPAFRPGFSVEISEFYDGLEHDLKIISDVYTIPAALHSIKFPFFNYDTVKPSGKWLTNFERFRVRKTDKITVSYLCRNSSTDYIAFRFYDADGQEIQTVNKMNPVNNKPEDVIHIHAGLAELGAFLGLSPATLDNAASYTITPLGGASLPFEVIAEDCRFPGVRVHFLNEWGAVDSFVFNLAHRRGSTIEKRKAKLRFEGSQLRPSTFGPTNTPYFIKFNDGLKLTSDFISDNESGALLELFTSPIVNIEAEQNIFFPASKGQRLILPAEVELTSYDVKQTNVDKLFNLEIDIKISVDNTRQSL